MATNFLRLMSYFDVKALKPMWNIFYLLSFRIHFSMYSNFWYNNTCILILACCGRSRAPARTIASVHVPRGPQILSVRLSQFGQRQVSRHITNTVSAFFNFIFSFLTRPFQRIQVYKVMTRCLAKMDYVTYFLRFLIKLMYKCDSRNKRTQTMIITS